MRAKLREGQARGRLQAVPKQTGRENVEEARSAVQQPTAQPRVSRHSGAAAPASHVVVDAPEVRWASALAETAPAVRASGAAPPAAARDPPAGGAVAPAYQPRVSSHAARVEAVAGPSSLVAAPVARREQEWSGPSFPWCVPELRGVGAPPGSAPGDVRSMHLALALALAKRDLARKLQTGVTLEQLAPPSAAQQQPQQQPQQPAEERQQQPATPGQQARRAAKPKRVSQPRAPVPDYVLPPRQVLLPKTPMRQPAARRQAQGAPPVGVDVATELWRLSGMRDPEEMTAVIQRLAKQHVELEMGMRDGYDTAEILLEDGAAAEEEIDRAAAAPLPLRGPGTSVYTRRAAPPRQQARAGRRGGGWDDSPVEQIPLQALRSKRDFLQWPPTKRGGLPAPDGPLPWAPVAPKRRAAPTAAPKRKVGGAGPIRRRQLPAVLEHGTDAADDASWEADEARLQQLTARSAALVHELRTMEHAAPAAVAAQRHVAPLHESQAAEAALSPTTAGQLLAALRDVEAESRVLRARWGLDSVPLDTAGPLRGTALERQRAAKSSSNGSTGKAAAKPRTSAAAAPPVRKPRMPAPSTGAAPASAVGAPLVERVMQGRAAFEAHKRSVPGAALFETLASESGGVDAAVVQEAVVERLLADELRLLASRVAADVKGRDDEAAHEDAEQWLVADVISPGDAAARVSAGGLPTAS